MLIVGKKVGCVTFDVGADVGEILGNCEGYGTVGYLEGAGTVGCNVGTGLVGCNVLGADVGSIVG